MAVEMKIISVGMIFLVILASTLAMPSRPRYPDRDMKKPKDALLPCLIGKYSYIVLNLMQL